MIGLLPAVQRGFKEANASREMWLEETALFQRHLTAERLGFSTGQGTLDFASAECAPIKCRRMQSRASAAAQLASRQVAHQTRFVLDSSSRFCRRFAALRIGKPKKRRRPEWHCSSFKLDRVRHTSHGNTASCSAPWSVRSKAKQISFVVTLSAHAKPSLILRPSAVWSDMLREEQTYRNVE
ncbi:hypothetical protein N658DRAFT_187916 [Parathielavia hyrcaniae]|uniref:Uncharacterized protein n=1 Tax=Parathielavia hyrcaniae TaxID=113614 RepID=A0AAN6T4R2_9PEZI|nr:hypothetical protein N658DRAFT_187916 [Parathielavia hyrcaniae]